jgi:hypothetical protein
VYLLTRMNKATSLLFLLILPLVANAQRVNVKDVLDRRSSINTPNKWKKWNCQNRKKNDITQFNLFCNTTSGFPSENPDTNTNAKILPDLIDICEDDGVRYLEKNKSNRDKINGISSAKICKTKCSQTKGCHYWSWNSDKNSCKLIKKVKNTGFRKQKDNAVSGSMKCRLSDNRSGGKCIGKSMIY